MKNNQNNHNYGESLKKLMSENLINVGGRLIEKVDGGYRWGGLWHSSLGDLQEALNERDRKILGNSLIPRPKPSLYKKFRFWLLGK